jgi:hypothetical protein
MNKFIGFFLGAFLFCFLPVGIAHAEITENQGLFHQNLKLFTGKANDSYLLLFPIEITQPGRIECEFKLLQPDEERFLKALENHHKKTGKSFVFRWSLVDSRFFDQKKPMQPGKFQQWIQKVNNYNPGEYLAGDQIRGAVAGAKAALDYVFGKKKKKEAPVYLHRYIQSVRFPQTPENHVTLGRMHHDIDFAELGQTQGMYFLVLENFSQLAPELEVKVSYPGNQRQVDKAFLLPRDLGITTLHVEAGKVQVEVQNLGEGELPEELYSRTGTQAATLMLWLNGKRWGGVTLQGLDPDRHLRNPGGKVLYSFNVAIADNTEVVSKLSLPNFEDVHSDNNERKQLYGTGKKILIPIGQMNP